MSKNNFKIALIGVEFEENLSLRYLAASLIANAYSQVKIYPYNSISDVEELVNLIIENDIDLVGVSMAFQVRAIDDITFVQLLRKKGFKKHITAGGQFATLHYNEIFKDCSGLSSIIRFEGESVIIQLADALATQMDLANVSALVWKDEQGKINVNRAIENPTNINLLSLPLRSSQRPEYLGLKRCHMLGSRGCHASCKYCCISALASERKEASSESVGLAAISRTRRRCAESVAEEIAYLYFNHDIKIFEFQDDNWIHPKTTVAVEYFIELKEALDKKGVGQIGLTLKTRADSVKPEIISVLKEIGLIRVFVGIESGTQTLLTKLGRKSRDNVSLQALEILRDFEIPAYFNALLFGPDIKFNDIEPELAFLDKCTDFPFEIVEVVIYGKTGLYQELKAENRLFGNYLDYDYEYLEKQTQQIHRIASRLDTRHFGVYSPIKMAADLGFNLGILQVFYPGEKTRQLAIEVAALNHKINSDQIQVLRNVSSLVVEGVPTHEIIEAFVAETVTSDLQFYREIIELHQKIENYVSNCTKKNSISSYFRAGAIVQSGLVASIFLMSLNSVYAQNENTIDLELKTELVKLVQDNDLKDWKNAKKKLKESKIPISNYLSLVQEAKDSIINVNSSDSVQLTENYNELSKKIKLLQQKRIKADYERLKDLLHEYNPKIKISTVLGVYLDDEGYVKDVRMAYKHSEDLSPDLKKIILDLLKEKQFYSYEARYYLTSSAKKRKIRKRFTKKRMRMGPLD